jgi:hypothetical protein
MKAKVTNSRNKGSAPTGAQVRSGASASMGSNKSLRTKSAKGSYEGYAYAPRADIVSRNEGYMSRDSQKARFAKRQDMNLGGDVNVVGGNDFVNPTAISNIGMRYTGSSRILKDRMELNGV